MRDHKHISLIKDANRTSTKKQKELVPEYYEKIVDAKIKAAEQIIKIWKFVVIFNTFAIIGIVVLNGFNIWGFYMGDASFITTIVSLAVSSFLLGSATKLLKIDRY